MTELDPLMAKRRVDQFHAQIEKRNHFQLFGVEPDTPMETVKEQYLRLAKAWHADAFVGIDLGERKRKLDEIFQRINEAFEVLSNPDQRAEYLTLLQRKKQGLSTDVTSILRAEGLVDDALGMLQKRQFAQARAAMEEAIKLNPDDPLYKVQLAWATYNENKKDESVQDRAVQMLKEALKKRDNMSEAYQFLGQIYFDRSDYKNAIKWWKVCLRWDSKNMEASRGMRLATTRLEKENRSGIAKFLDKMLGR